MTLRERAAAAWRKNHRELLGAFSRGLPGFVFASQPKPLESGVPVFCYHTIDAKTFDSHLEFLRRNRYHTLSAEDLLRHTTGERIAPPQSVALTFDDGPLNFHRVVFPALLKYRARAIAFIAPGLHMDEIPSRYAQESERTMTWAEVRELHDSGLVDVESHTLESRYVPRWPSPVPLSGVKPAFESEQRRDPLGLAEDLRQAKALIESHLPGKTVRHLAFPRYEGTAAALQIAKDCGYEAFHWGVLPNRGLNHPGMSPLRIGRISYEFVLRLPGPGRISLSDTVRNRMNIIRGVAQAAT